MIDKILTGGLHGRAFQAYIKSNYPEIECLLSTSKEDSIQMINEVGAIAGFNFIPPTDLTHIKWIHSFGAGIDSFLGHELDENLIMTKTTGEMGQRIAEYCLTYILQSLQEVSNFKQQQQNKQWQQQHLPQLSEVVVYIFGTGFIGQSIAKLLAPITAKVIGINTSGKAKDHFSQCMSISQCKNQLFEKEAVIINALPLTDSTTSLFNEGLFSLMEKVLFINIGRGGSVEDKSLVEALKTQHVKHAVLDVFIKEPLPLEHPYWELDQVTITPHISGITSFPDIKSSFKIVYEALKSGGSVPNQVNLGKQY